LLFVVWFGGSVTPLARRSPEAIGRDRRLQIAAEKTQAQASPHQSLLRPPRHFHVMERLFPRDQFDELPIRHDIARTSIRYVVLTGEEALIGPGPLLPWLGWV